MHCGLTGTAGCHTAKYWVVHCMSDVDPNGIMSPLYQMVEKEQHYVTMQCLHCDKVYSGGVNCV